MKNPVLKWFSIARPGTLAAAASPVFIGLLITVGVGAPFHWTIAFVTFLAAVSIQISANFINDYYDYKKGTDSVGRLGPRRAISAGDVSPLAMKWAIGIALGTAALCGLFLVFTGGWPIFIIGIFSLLFAWLYTATRFSLSYLGIADVFVLIFFGPVATVGTFYLQAGSFSMQAFWYGCVCGLISTAVLVVNNVRDYESDRAAGKRTLIVRKGKHFGEMEYLLVFLLCIPCLWLGGAKGLLYCIVLPALLLYSRLKKAEGSVYNRILIQTGLLNLLFVLLCFCEVFFLPEDTFIGN
ncbi:MAG: 1,4-dihydroxy-2-naphthoate octaprenyltransferase [Bacteroidales bacterium]|nr:1,4-dihydroxy-2-naphthoate octaprenyltransferase [Bacteroidales bacterium]